MVWCLAHDDRSASVQVGWGDDGIDRGPDDADLLELVHAAEHDDPTAQPSAGVVAVQRRDDTMSRAGLPDGLHSCAHAVGTVPRARTQP